MFDKILNNYEFYVNNYAKGAPLIEMRMLGISEKLEKDLFNSLPILPYDNKEIIFDPSSYGQYLNGSHLKRGNYIFVRRWISTGHIVGRELKSKRILVNYSNNKPTVKYDNSIFELANLHVHSKKLHKFLPSKYRNIVSI